ncbi:MAG: hypothetical protein AAF809_01675 [Bacteroidota bacterium]
MLRLTGLLAVLFVALPAAAQSLPDWAGPPGSARSGGPGACQGGADAAGGADAGAD